MKVTNADTVSDVFHFADTACVSHKKNTVDAIRAIDINQNEIPTKSSGCKFAAAWAIPGTSSNIAAVAIALKPTLYNGRLCPTLRITLFIFIVISLVLKSWFYRFQTFKRLHEDKPKVVF